MSIECWDITPFVSVGPLTFGMPRTHIANILGPATSTFKKGPNATSDTDSYDTLGIHLYCDDNNQLECVELFGVVHVSFREIPLLNSPIIDVLDRLQTVGFTYHVDDGYFVNECGFVLSELDGIVRTVTVYRKGYF